MRVNRYIALMAASACLKTRLAAFGLMMISVLPSTKLQAQQLYWSQFGTPRQLGRVALDGTGVSVLVQANRPLGMEALDSTRHIFWIDQEAASIRRANADFTGSTTIVSGLGSPNHLNLAIDEAANLVFWSNSDTHTIGRAPLSGGPVIGTFPSPASYPDDLAVDPANQKLYWTTQFDGVNRSNYDGSDQSLVLSTPSWGPSGLDLDLVAGKMYLAVPNQSRILSANLDGTGAQTILTLPHRPFGMELFGGRMYWADLDGGTLNSAKLDGSDHKIILSGLSLPRQVSIMSAIPEPEGFVLVAFGGLGLLIPLRTPHATSADLRGHATRR